MCFAISCFFLAFPKNAQKNNAREVAKISLAFSLAFILQIQLFSAKVFPLFSCPQKCTVEACKFSALLLTAAPIRNNLIL